MDSNRFEYFKIWVNSAKVAYLYQIIYDMYNLKVKKLVNKLNIVNESRSSGKQQRLTVYFKHGTSQQDKVPVNVEK